MSGSMAQQQNAASVGPGVYILVTPDFVTAWRVTCSKGSWIVRYDWKFLPGVQIHDQLSIFADSPVPAGDTPRQLDGETSMASPSMHQFFIENINYQTNQFRGPSGHDFTISIELAAFHRQQFLERAQDVFDNRIGDLHAEIMMSRLYAGAAKKSDRHDDVLNDMRLRHILMFPHVFETDPSDTDFMSQIRDLRAKLRKQWNQAVTQCLNQTSPAAAVARAEQATLVHEPVKPSRSSTVRQVLASTSRVHSQESFVWEATNTADMDIFISNLPYITSTVICSVQRVFRTYPHDTSAAVRSLLDLRTIESTPLYADFEAESTKGFQVPCDYRYSKVTSGGAATQDLLKEMRFAWLGFVKTIILPTSPPSLQVAVGAYRCDISELFSFARDLHHHTLPAVGFSPSSSSMVSHAISDVAHDHPLPASSIHHRKRMPLQSASSPRTHSPPAEDTTLSSFFRSIRGQ